MLIQYKRKAIGDKEHIQYSKSTLRVLKGAPSTGDFKDGIVIPKFPSGEPIGCVVAIPEYDESTPPICTGFRIGWSLFNEKYEKICFTKYITRKVAVKKAFKNTVTDPETGADNFPHSLTDLIEFMMLRGRMYYKTENIINYA